MKRTIWMSTGFIVLALVFIIATACQIDPENDPPAKVETAFVYHTVDSEGLLYESFLASNGYSVTLLEADDLNLTDLSGYELFLVGHSADNTVWDSSSKTELITGTGKPVVGLAKGSYVFSYLSQHLSGGSAMAWTGTPNNTIRPQETTHDIWNQPNDTGIATNDPVQVYVDDGFHETLKDAFLNFLAYMLTK